jgi:hypothetical protein
MAGIYSCHVFYFMRRKKQNIFLRQTHHGLDALLKLIYPHKGFSGWRELILVFGFLAFVFVLFLLGMGR